MIDFFLTNCYNIRKFALYPSYLERQQEVFILNKQSVKNRELVLTALFAAIIILLAFTPFGYIQLMVIKATIIHIPVIIGSILLGPKRGAILGGLFGLTSLISNSMTPTLLSFAFSFFVPVPGTAHGSALSLVICFIPRILVGIVPYYVYRAMQKLFKNSLNAEYFSLLLGGISGALTNTILVMGLIYILFRDAYATAKNIPVDAVSAAVLGVVGMNGVPEALVAAVITVAVCKPLLRLRRKKTA
jgi:uncharacterized membrane protein